MKLQREVFVLVVIATVAVVVGDKWLSVKPDFLKPCKLTDVGFNSCYRDNFRALFVEWKDGVPGLKSVGALDPFYVKRVVIDNGPSQPVSINADLHNIEVTGLGGVIIKEVSLDIKTLVAKSILVVPKVRMESDYDIKGRILSLALNGDGKAFMNAENLEIRLAFHLKLRDEGGFTFTDIDKFRLDIAEVGGFHIRLDNLFHGQTVLEESTNAVFNENWREFYEILRPAIKGAIEKIMSDRLTKVYAYVPASFLIEDIPTAAEYQG